MSEPFSLVDDLRVQHAKPLKAWLEQNKAHIEVFYLPSYCPELNPDETFDPEHVPLTPHERAARQDVPMAAEPLQTSKQRYPFPTGRALEDALHRSDRQQVNSITRAWHGASPDHGERMEFC